MIKVYTGLKGSAVLLFFIAALVLVSSVLFWGFTGAMELLLPVLTVGAYFFILLFVVFFLPASFNKSLRPSLGVYAMMMSTVLSAAAWMLSFLFVVKGFGVGWAIVFAFLFQFLAPMAVIGAIFKSAWPIAIHLVVWMIFSIGMRYYARQMMEQAAPRPQKGDIIDVDVVDPPKPQDKDKWLES